MAFQEVRPFVHFPELEEEILQFWRQNRTFEKSLEIRKDAPRFVFYEGPPTANGRPGIHHVLARVFKDLFPRYKTMRGYYSLRKGGWDTHGLPVELEVEKELGITHKRQIEEFGVDKFNQLCKESVFRYIQEWRQMTERIGFWIDMDNAYVTYHNEYIESIWWILRQFWDKGLLYKDYKVVPYCPRCGTPLSTHEQHYPGAIKEVDDPSVYVKFKVRDQEKTFFLVWTTTPWTLPGNVALAVHPEYDYVTVEHQGERLILAKARLHVLDGPYTVVEEHKGKDLAGIHYEPLYSFLPVDRDYAYVVNADFVTLEDGTGVVHMAPAFGAEDLEVGREYGLPVLMTVAADGTFIDAVEPWKGMFVKDADPLIEEDLRQRGLLYKAETYRHNYPHCWRCGTPLLYYAREAWYVRVTAHKEDLIANNEQINWVPDHIKHGRFGKWLENIQDWALSRDRYWGTPLPIWECENPQCKHRECIGSVAELSEKSGQDLSGLDLHRPYVDEVTYSCPECGGTMRRVPDLIDVWFDSGAMPVAQWHYPFENQEMFQEQFPADFICEAVDQTRGWFYSLHAESTLLFNQPSFLNVICLGLILDEKGEKMSKSRGNMVDPWDVLNAYGADATRWYMYTATPPGNARRFSLNLVGEVVRKFLHTLWNSYAFFVTYANASNWTPPAELAERVVKGEAPEEVTPAAHPLDRWILAELHALTRDVTEGLDAYDVTNTGRAIEAFVDSLSNWYLRRSRRRFWDGDPAAFATLYEVLVTLSKLIAPYMPFLSEVLWQNLVRSVALTAAESVHLADWPAFEPALIDEELREDVALAQRIVRAGHAARQQAGLKVRQPLRRLVVRLREPEERERLERVIDQVLEELNVKEWAVADKVEELAEVKVHALPKQLGQKYGRLYPKIREALGQMDQVALARKFRGGETVPVEVEGQVLEIQPDEVDVRITPRAGYAVAESGGYMVAVTTELDEELKVEGMAREFVRRVQNLRKKANLHVTDRIYLYVQGGENLRRVLDRWGDYIKQETLALEIVPGVPKDVPHDTFRLNGEEVLIGVERARGG
ncbi:MAG: isoleucine--tRNA ligase [Chloroflexi bacterium]|nr:isoleucine--tRNA ligase [Chloroflexota bacterium]